jgi:hypothetical protein
MLQRPFHTPISPVETEILINATYPNDETRVNKCSFEYDLVGRVSVPPTSDRVKNYFILQQVNLIHRWPNLATNGIVSMIKNGTTSHAVFERGRYSVSELYIKLNSVLAKVHPDCKLEKKTFDATATDDELKSNKRLLIINFHPNERNRDNARRIPPAVVIKPTVYQERFDFGSVGLKFSIPQDVCVKLSKNMCELLGFFKLGDADDSAGHFFSKEDQDETFDSVQPPIEEPVQLIMMCIHGLGLPIVKFNGLLPHLPCVGFFTANATTYGQNIGNNIYAQAFQPIQISGTDFSTLKIEFYNVATGKLMPWPTDPIQIRFKLTTRVE